MTATATPKNSIKKLYVSETVFFAINNIPLVDRTTLEKFLELVNATGTFGALSHEQILTKMRLTLRYVPNVCPRSLQILAELLDIPVDPATGNQLQSSAAPLVAASGQINQAQIPAA
jgi:hypothetical protein